MSHYSNLTRSPRRSVATTNVGLQNTCVLCADGIVLGDESQGPGGVALSSALVPRATNCVFFVPKDSESD